ncbi:hypothetical protein CKY28_15975 [Sphingomonas lenta]|uniref:Uncharacterized protein n=1 Tax=Sphingomonas lenta TaxID=1141887 RepID=A0A2A2SBK5_9SPHN|nr:hypothetical protein CKY28_15975 [Sphingomonas lenta]
MSFQRKVAAAFLLVVLAHQLFFGHEPGWTLGGFALAWAAALAIAAPAVRRRAALPALGAAALFGLVLVDDPSPLAWALFWTSVSSAALLTRVRFDDAARWAVRLAAYAVAAPFRLLGDALRLLRRGTGGGARTVIGTLALPVIGGAVFILLFAGANPLIGEAVGRLEPPSFWETVVRLVFWGAVLVTVWPSFRPYALRLPTVRVSGPLLPDPSVATLTLSLLTFNVIFAVENALDLLFLWSGAPLPGEVTLADYAHRGAYLLIVTALLAGAFVLVALRPGGPGARSPLVRRLVVLWIAQNLLLVASSARRTLDYVDAYQMTVLRLAALAWMALVAVGLVLVCWRMLRGRSAAWLLNANALAAALTLAGASVVDLEATAAAYNVRNAREGDRIDLCYLQQLGTSALIPLVELERRAGGPVLRDRVAYLREDALAQLRREQGDWRSWTWRGARRLAAAEAIVGPEKPRPPEPANGRACGGAPLPPPPPQVQPPARPLTAEARP